MTIDNFERFEKNIMRYSLYISQSNYRYLQIITRNKDGVENSNIRSYFIKSIDQLEQLKPEIIQLCKLYKARAYINPSPKSFKKLQLNMLKKISDNLVNDIIQSGERILYHCAGEDNGIKEGRYWVLDIDEKGEMVNQVKDWLDIYDKLYIELPTPHGYHLITYPFNITEFHKKFPGIEIKKNSAGTLLYYTDEKL